MTTNLTQGIVQVMDNGIWSINDALRQVTQRADYLKGLSGPVVINNRVSVSNPVVTLDAVNLGSLTTTLASYVPITRLINTTTPLAGGGDLSADRTLTLGTVPIAKGGTNNTSFTNKSVFFFDGTKFAEDNANLFYDPATGILTSNYLKTLSQYAVGSLGVIGGSQGQTIIDANEILSAPTGAQLPCIDLHAEDIGSGIGIQLFGIRSTLTESGTPVSGTLLGFGSVIAQKSTNALTYGAGFFSGFVMQGTGGMGSFANFRAIVPGASSTGRPTTLYGLWVEAPNMTNIPTAIGTQIDNMGKTGGTNAYGIRVAAQSGATNNMCFNFLGDGGVAVSKKIYLEAASAASPGSTYLWANGAGKPELFVTGTKVWDATTTQFTCDVNFGIADAKNCVLGSTTGTIWGSVASQKQAWWGAAPIVQPTTAIAAAAFVANTSLIANDSATWDGYTIGQMCKALRNEGLLA